MTGNLDGLNEEQRAAVEAVHGPVCILAGAGSGKTTTITRRIANQVASGAFSPEQILAVTFTDKAAKEMASRLAVLGVRRVRAKTFHAEALAQVHQLRSDGVELLGSKAQVLIGLVKSLPPPHRFTAVRDIAGEIEWAKNRMLRPEGYVEAVGSRQTPIPADLMASVFAGYEKRKARAKLMDFEDLLALVAQTLREDQAAAARIRDRYRTFTVDEYQDVNLLQQSLLDAWVGDRRDVCVVGDDYQSIFGFTGATPDYLLRFPQRFHDARLFRLTKNYRSTPQILASSNRLVPHLRGSAKVLEPTRPPGSEVVLRPCETADEEAAWIVRRCRELNAEGIAWDEIAILYRINARSEPFEEALTDAAIPYQVADSPFLRRPGPRAALLRLRRAQGADAAAVVENVVTAIGYREEGTDAEGDEATRQADLGRLLALARSFDGQGVDAFVSDLISRFTEEENAKGIQLLTYHRAKGKEFSAVFLPRCEEGEIPFALAKSDDAVVEERRLLYVGMTRAKAHLHISWAAYRENERRQRPQPSRFLRELGAITLAPSVPQQASQKVSVKLEDRALYESLVAWRNREAARSRTAALPTEVVLAAIARRRPADFGELLDVPGIDAAASAVHGVDILALVAKAGDRDNGLLARLKELRTSISREKGVPAYVVFPDSTLAALAERRPTSLEEMMKVKGVGPAKLEEFGEQFLEAIRSS